MKNNTYFNKQLKNFSRYGIGVCPSDNFNREPSKEGTEEKKPIIFVDRPINNLPNNSFINWLSARYERNDIIFNVEYSTERNVSEFITRKSIESWNSYEPIFISAQTGFGKNHFIKQNIVQYILEYNASYSRKKSILILSNRIALNRQSKLDYADLIFKATGDRDVYDKLEELYTFKGFDKFYMDFTDCITICSYHQLLDRRILDDREYTYIVCDEAHFFIQDSTFNKYTDDMLRYIVDKGRNSIRIYMSATLNLVMEPILREEYKKVELANIEFHKQYVPNIIERFLREGTKIALNTRIYYMKRNYDFIKKVYKFESLNELITTINNSRMKWLVFVKSKADGELIEKSLTKRSRIFLSRERIDKDPKIEQIYNDIVENQYYTQEVLITTSVLDNGINLLPDKDHHPIRNIVLFSLDKTQFLQMLGRVRTIKEKCLNIFLYNYTKDNIKYYLDRTVDDLVGRLQCDLWDIEEKRENFNDKYYKFTDDYRFCDYNDYSIMKALDAGKRLSDMYVFSRDRVKDNTLHCSTNELESSRNQLIFRLKTIWKDIHSYSGSVYYLLEQCDKVLDEYFDFENYFYGVILPDHFYNEIEKRIDMLMGLLTTEKINKIKHEVKKKYNKDTRSFRLHQHLKLVLNELEKDGLVMFCKEYNYFALANSYTDLSTSIANDCSLDEQLDWITNMDEDAKTFKYSPNGIKEYNDKDKKS